MVDFCCPNLLGRYSAFARQYEKPIMKSRTPGCSTAQLEDGQMRAKEVGFSSIRLTETNECS